jgi:hypothetical protein
MHTNSKLQFKRPPRWERGQFLPWVAVLTISALGIAGVSIDLGHALVVRQQLQNIANAAAMAASQQVLFSSATNYAQSTADSYAGGTYNGNTSVGALSQCTAQVTTNCYSVSPVCVQAIAPSGTTCSTSSLPNAIQVTESQAVKTWFMPILGFKTLNVKATSIATMEGAPQAWNVAIILDATSSMGSWGSSGTPSSCTGFSSPFACALNGIAGMLGTVNPCAGSTTCTTGSSGNSNFRVALFSFPNVSSSTVSDFWSTPTCSTPTSVPYTFPATNLTSYSPVVSTTDPLHYATSPTVATTYEDTPINSSNGAVDGDANGFVVNYYVSKGVLNTNSSLVKELNGCLTNPGGESTYYAGVIYAAQAALQAEHTLYPNSKNAMIILSDGQANVTESSKLASGAPTATTGGAPASDYLKLASGTTYPSGTNECQQAITAAQAAQSATPNTAVYSVAFQSESGGCTGSGGTDTSISATATTGQPALSLATLSPCIVMKNMATPANSTTGVAYFYADTSSQTSGSCTNGTASVDAIGSIAGIFNTIGTTFDSAGLLPPGTTAVVTTTW